MCGCGKPKVQRSTRSQTPAMRTMPTPSNKVEAAKTYQSATMQAPRAPITRQTV